MVKIQDNIVIVEASRTAIGNFGGSLSRFTAHELGAHVIKNQLARIALDAADIDEVILGHVLTAGCGQNTARQASILAGIPKHTPAWTINQVCGSGLKSVALGVQSILSGQSQIVVAGGQENMSASVHAMPMRQGTKMGNATLIDTMISDGLWDAFGDYHMGQTAENIAKEQNISREEQDEFAAASQAKAQAAQESNAFHDEIIPITIPNRKGDDIIFEKDEFPRYNTNTESLAKLRPAFVKDGTVTAGNASGINDGAASVVIMSAKEAEKRHITPLARVVSFAQAGVDPAIMGTGPIPASQNALASAGWSVDELDAIEANEAFAAQAIAVNNAMGWDSKKVNTNGGAIALGHPIGASGTRIITTLLHRLKQASGQKGLATLCVGGGMGVAMCFESC